MKKCFVVFTLLFVFILSSCTNDNNSNKLSGKTFDLVYAPVPLEEDINNPSKYQSFMKLEFSGNNKVSHTVYNEIEGTYELNEDTLIITFKNENEKLKISLLDFRQSERDFSTYTALIGDTESDIKDPNKIEYFQLIINKLNKDMPIELIEIEE